MRRGCHFVLLILASFSVAVFFTVLISWLVSKGALSLRWSTLVGIHSGHIRIGNDLIIGAVTAFLLTMMFSAPITNWRRGFVALGVSASVSFLLLCVFFVPVLFSRAGITQPNWLIQGGSAVATIFLLALLFLSCRARQRL
jgi:hypothetical protein